jgi:hypothetical protein
LTIQTVVTHGDVLKAELGQRHRGPLLSLAKQVWPRALLRRTCRRCGLYMLIEVTKETSPASQNP